MTELVALLLGAVALMAGILVLFGTLAALTFNLPVSWVGRLLVIGIVWTAIPGVLYLIFFAASWLPLDTGCYDAALSLSCKAADVVSHIVQLRVESGLGGFALLITSVVLFVVGAKYSHDQKERNSGAGSK